MKKKTKRILIITIIILTLVFSITPKLKLEFHRKHIHKKHKPRMVKIKPVDTLEMEREVFRYKLFTREQVVKKRKLELKKHKEKQARIKREHEKRLEVERKKEQNKQVNNTNYIIKDIVVTAYCTSGTTANGTQTREGYTLAAPPEYDFGTKIDLGEGIGVRIVSDRGGLIKGNTFDLYMSSEKQAREFGRRTIKAKIYKN